MPNPILADYREHKDDGPVGYTNGGGFHRLPGTVATFTRHRPTRLEHYLLQLENAEHDPVLTLIGLGVTATPAEIITARKVLTRLSHSTRQH